MLLDTYGDRVYVECGQVMARMLRERLLFCIKYILRNALFNMRVADPPPLCQSGDLLGRRIMQVICLQQLFFTLFCASRRNASRVVRFFKSRLQA